MPTLSHNTIALRRSTAGGLAIVLVFAMLSVSRPAAAGQIERIVICDFAAPVYQAVWRYGVTSETLLLQKSLDELKAKDRELRPQGWRLRQMRTHVYECNGNVGWSFDALWRLEGNIPETAVFAMGWSDFNRKNDEMRAAGWRLSTLDAFESSNQTFFNAVWRNTVIDQIDLFGWGRADFVARARELTSSGWVFYLIDAYSLRDNSRRYNAAFRRGSTPQNSIIGWSPQDYDTEYSRLRSLRYNLLGLTSSLAGGIAVDAFWGPGNVSEERRTNMSADQFLNAQKNFQLTGWGIHLFDKYF